MNIIIIDPTEWYSWTVWKSSYWWFVCWKILGE